MKPIVVRLTLRVVAAVVLDDRAQHGVVRGQPGHADALALEVARAGRCPAGRSPPPAAAGRARRRRRCPLRARAPGPRSWMSTTAMSARPAASSLSESVEDDGHDRTAHGAAAVDARRGRRWAEVEREPSSPEGSSAASPPHPPSAAISAITRGIRRTASNPTSTAPGHPQQEVAGAGSWTRRIHRRVHRHAAARLLHHRRRLALHPASRRAANPNPFIDFSVIGLVHVFVLFVLIQTLAVISGAHFNPAVTAAMTALRQIKPPDAAYLRRRPAARRRRPARCSPRRSCWTRARRRTTAPSRSPT